jgi:Uma2 family endonuclease
MSQVAANPYLVLYSVPWDTYQGILGAIGERPLRHTYDQGTFELPRLIYGVSWEEYSRFLKATADYYLRHTYDGYTLELMTPLKSHEWIKTIVGRMIETMAFDLHFKIQSVGSTTLPSTKVEKGVQPDEGYYITNELIVRGKSSYEPDVDPPPDLIIEIDVTSSCVPRFPIFALLGIREIWHYSNGELEFLWLTEKGEYVRHDSSREFPFIESSAVEVILDQYEEVDEDSLIRQFVNMARERYSRLSEGNQTVEQF